MSEDQCCIFCLCYSGSEFDSEVHCLRKDCSIINPGEINSCAYYKDAIVYDCQVTCSSYENCHPLTTI